MLAANLLTTKGNPVVITVRKLTRNPVAKKKTLQKNMIAAMAARDNVKMHLVNVPQPRSTSCSPLLNRYNITI